MTLAETALVSLIVSVVGAAFGAYLGYRLAKSFEIERMIKRQDEEKIEYLKHIAHDLQDMIDYYNKAEPFIFNTGNSQHSVKLIGFRESVWLRQGPIGVNFSLDLAHYLDIVYSNLKDIDHFKEDFRYLDDLLWQYKEGKISQQNLESRVNFWMDHYKRLSKALEEDVPITFALLNIEIVLTAINKDFLSSTSPFRIEDVEFEKIPSVQDEHTNIQVLAFNSSVYAEGAILCGTKVEEVPLVKSFNNTNQEVEKLRDYLIEKIGAPLKEADKKWRLFRNFKRIAWGISILAIIGMISFYLANLSVGLLISGLTGTAATVLEKLPNTNNTKRIQTLPAILKLVAFPS